MIIKNPTIIIKKESGGGSGTSSALLELVSGTSEVNLTKEDLGNATQINNYAFYGREKLKSIEYPDALTQIGDYAFANSGLTGTVVVPYLDKVYQSPYPKLGISAYEGCTNITKLIINAPQIHGNLSNMRYFYGCTGLTEVEFGETCETASIGSYAFAKCTALPTIILPSTVTVLTNNCFQGCSSLETINLPEGVYEIQGYAFDSCSKLSNISLPNALTHIGEYAFQGSGLSSSIIIPSGITKINNYTFNKCSSLPSITIPASVSSIGEYAFQYCYALTSVTILEGLTGLARGAFRYCTSLPNITIPSSVASIDRTVFNNCTALTEMTILATTPPTLTNKDAISDATTTIYIPAGTLSAYQTATNWSNFADKFVELSA